MNNEPNERPEHLEEIRDIIFGPQKRDFENRIREIHEQIEAAKTQFAQMIEALNSSLLDELRSLSHDVDEKLNHAEERSNASRLELLQNLQQTETRFTASMQSAIQTSAERIASLSLLLRQTGEMFDGKLREHEQRSEANNLQVLDRMQHTQDDFIRQLNEVHAGLRQQHEALAIELKTHAERAVANRDDLLKQMSFLESRFDKSVANAIQTAAEKIGGLDMQMNANQKKLQTEISALRSDVMHALDKRITELANSKVSRDSMAETLMELAKRFKADERSDLKLITQSNIKTP